MKKTTIFLADDHQILRAGLRALLESKNHFTIVGEASDGIEAVKMVRELNPEVLVVDLMMKGLNGLEVIRQVRKQSPDTKVIVLSMHANEAYLFNALKNGAVGYVLKDSTATDLITAINEALAGRHYLSQPLSHHAIAAYLAKAQEKPIDPYETLTSREREVLQLAAEGHTSTQIAAKLFASPRTIEVHRANLMRKLGLRGQIELIRFAIKHGIVDQDSTPEPSLNDALEKETPGS